MMMLKQQSCWWNEPWNRWKWTRKAEYESQFPGEKTGTYYGYSDSRMHWVLPCQAQRLDWQIYVTRSSQLKTVERGNHSINLLWQCSLCTIFIIIHPCFTAFAQVQALVSFSWEGKRILAGQAADGPHGRPNDVATSRCTSPRDVGTWMGTHLQLGSMTFVRLQWFLVRDQDCFRG